MPTRNVYYRDPALAQAFNSLASAFAPPSGSDLAGYATARARREEANRLAEIFNYAKSPDYNREMADRMAIAGGRYNPNQSFYSVDLGNATQRYGIGVGAQTSRMNNAADNARALEVAAGNNRTSVVGQMFQPLNPGQVRPAVPSEIAGRFGLPELPMESGAPAPISETQARGAAFNDLRANGTLTDQQIMDTIIGKEAPVQALGPDGKPVYMSRGAAIRQGAQPVQTQSGAPKIISYKSPAGASGTARFDPASSQFIDTQTGQVIPPGSVEVRAQGTPDDALGQGTKNAIDKQLLNISQAQNTVGRYADLVRSAPGVQGLVGRMQGTLQNVMQAGGEVAALLSENQQATQALLSQNRFAPEVAQRFAGFRTDIPAAEALRQMLIAQVAAATTNDDQVSNRDIERVELQIGGGSFFSNAADTLARLDQVNKDLAARQQQLQRAATPGARIFGGQPAAPNAPTPQPNAQPQQRTRLRFDAEGNQIQ